MEDPVEYKSISYMEGKIEYAIGILEMVQVLISSPDEDMISDNINHLKNVLPKALEELKKAKRE